MQKLGHFMLLSPCLILWFLVLSLKATIMEEFVFFLAIDYRLEIRVKLEAKTTKEVMRKVSKMRPAWFRSVCLGSAREGAWSPVSVLSIPHAAVCVLAKLLQSCLTLCNPVDHSLPDSSVHGILQARILEWVAMPSCRGSSPPLMSPALAGKFCQSLMSPELAGKFFTTCTTQETHILLHHQTTLQWNLVFPFGKSRRVASRDHLEASWPHGWTKQVSHTGSEFLSATHSLWDSFSLCN